MSKKFNACFLAHFSGDDAPPTKLADIYNIEAKDEREAEGIARIIMAQRAMVIERVMSISEQSTQPIVVIR